MNVSPINSSFKPAFRGDFVKTKALEKYVNSLDEQEFDSFKKNYDIMKNIKDGKEYTYKVEKYEGRQFGAIIDENSNYIARECICIDDKYTGVPSYLKSYEDSLFKELFDKYTKLDLRKRKLNFLHGLSDSLE